MPFFYNLKPNVKLKKTDLLKGKINNNKIDLYTKYCYYYLCEGHIWVILRGTNV